MFIAHKTQDSHRTVNVNVNSNASQLFLDLSSITASIFISRLQARLAASALHLGMSL